MEEKNLKDITILQFELLNDNNEIFHFITTRNGGVSIGNYNSLNCSYSSGDLVDNVNQNRKILSENLGIDYNKFYFPEQKHTKNIKIITKEDHFIKLNETDALITNLQNVAICVTTADCVPLLLYAPDRKVVAVVHAGWRGQVLRLPYLTVMEMLTNFNVDVHLLLAAIGPCISSDIYEVGPEVIKSVNEFFPDAVIKETENGKGYLNLEKMTKQQLLSAGIKESNIQTSDICNYKNIDLFSARRDGFNTGRFVTGIMIKKL